MTPSPAHPSPGVWNGKTAFLLGGIFLILFAVSALLVHWDAATRSQLETLTPSPQTPLAHP